MKCRLVMNTNNSNSTGKIVRPCSKHKAKTVAKKNGLCTHVPTVRCHEEVMSKLSHYDTDGFGETIAKNQKPGKKTKKNEMHVTEKAYVQPKDIQERLGVSNREKESFHKALCSKSVPIFQNSYLEDSVDFIPVKLASNSNFKEQLSLQNTIKPNGPSLKKSSKQKSTGSCRATWDKLLKGESQSLMKISKMKDGIANSARSSENHLQVEESWPNTPKKKVSITTSNRKYGNEIEEPYIDLTYKLSELPKTNELLFDPLTACDPVKKLDFLIRQLREKLLKQPENDNLQKIILDMENALMKISIHNDVYPKNLQEDIIKEYPSNIATKSVISNGSDGKDNNGYSLNIAQLQKGLEESCLFLQSLCIRQRERCSNHMREKEQLTLQLAESRRLLAIAKSKEKDYEVTLGEFRLKIQESNTRNDQKDQAVQELTDTVAKLRTENEILKSSKETVKRLSGKVKELASEKEILISKLHLKDLEIERLKVLLEVKENLNPITKDHKKGLNKYVEQEQDNSLLSLSTVTSWTQDKPGLICSSQASSSPRHSPSPYNSWQYISSIYQRPSAASEINKDIANIFQNLKKKAEQNEPPQLYLELPSSCSSYWSDKEEQCINTIQVFSDHGNGTSSS